jgi:uracil-DNA glycosylase
VRHHVAVTSYNKPAYAAGLLLDDFYFPGSIAARHARLGEPDVARLNAFAQRLAADNDEHVPAFDPDSGGRKARVLLLLQDPSRIAAYESRLISRHTNDSTAGNTFTACEEAGLDYKEALHWNVIPWWAQDPAKDPAPGKHRSLAVESRRAGPYLAETLKLLPNLRSVALVGRKAQSAWDRASKASGGSQGHCLRLYRCPHTSPLAWNMIGPDGSPNRETTIRVLREAAGG